LLLWVSIYAHLVKGRGSLLPGGRKYQRKQAAAEKEEKMAIYNGSNANSDGQNREIEYKLVEKLGVLDTHKSGWAREVNIVAWNGKPPKFDIRDWDPEHERMSRGITLHEREAVKLAKILVQRLQMDEPQAQAQTQQMPQAQQESGEEYQEQLEANGTDGGLLF
jgi:hypothetical protein